MTLSEPRNSVKWLKLNEVIISLNTGLNPRKNFKLNEPGNKFPYITGKDVSGNKINITDRTDRINKDAVLLINRRAHLEVGDVMFVSTGTGTVGRMALINHYENNFGVSETMFILKPKRDVIIPKYLMFYLTSSLAKRQYETKISKGSVPHLKVNDLMNVKIPIPTFDVQKNIVSILDRFDAICSDLKSGLPAEIAARKKQYEYYRDKLLSFQ